MVFLSQRTGAALNLISCSPPFSGPAFRSRGDARGRPCDVKKHRPLRFVIDGSGWGLRQPETVATAAPATLDLMNWRRFMGWGGMSLRAGGGRGRSQVAQHIEGWFVGNRPLLARGEEVEQVDTIGSGSEEFGGGTPVIFGGEVLLSAAPGAFDAAIDGDGCDSLFPRGDGQVAAFVKEFGNRHPVNPTPPDPGRHVATDFPRAVGCGGSAPEVRTAPVPRGGAGGHARRRRGRAGCGSARPASSS